MINRIRFERAAILPVFLAILATLYWREEAGTIQRIADVIPLDVYAVWIIVSMVWLVYDMVRSNPLNGFIIVPISFANWHSMWIILESSQAPFIPLGAYAFLNIYLWAAFVTENDIAGTVRSFYNGVRYRRGRNNSGS